jgi:hypothetical protein
MVKYIVSFMLLLISLKSFSQADPWYVKGECDKKLNQIRNRVDSVNHKYQVESEEYKQGLFCSDCMRPKSQIEAEEGVSFQSHIQQGASHGRHIIPATQEQMNQQYDAYLQKYKSQADDFYSTKDECDKRLAAEINKMNEEAEEERKRRQMVFEAHLKNLQDSIKKQREALDQKLLELQQQRQDNKQANALANSQQATKQDLDEMDNNTENSFNQVQDGLNKDLFDNGVVEPLKDAFNELKEYLIPNKYKDDYKTLTNLQSAYNDVTKPFETVQKYTDVANELSDGEFGAHTQEFIVDGSIQNQGINKHVKSNLNIIRNHFDRLEKVADNTFRQMDNMTNFNQDDDNSNQTFHDQTTGEQNREESKKQLTAKHVVLGVLGAGLVVYSAPAIFLIAGGAMIWKSW